LDNGPTKEDIKNFLEGNIDDVICNINKRARTKKRNLNSEEYNLTKKEFISAMYNAIQISYENMQNSVWCIKKGVSEIKNFTILQFISFLLTVFKDIVTEVKISIYCVLCIVLGPVITSNFRSRLKFIYDEWILEVIIKKTN